MMTYTMFSILKIPDYSSVAYGGKTIDLFKMHLVCSHWYSKLRKFDNSSGHIDAQAVATFHTTSAAASTITSNISRFNWPRQLVTKTLASKSKSIVFTKTYAHFLTAELSPRCSESSDPSDICGPTIRKFCGFQVPVVIVPKRSEIVVSAVGQRHIVWSLMPAPPSVFSSRELWASPSWRWVKNFIKRTAAVRVSKESVAYF